MLTMQFSCIKFGLATPLLTEQASIMPQGIAYQMEAFDVNLLVMIWILVQGGVTALPSNTAVKINSQLEIFWLQSQMVEWHPLPINRFVCLKVPKITIIPLLNTIWNFWLYINNAMTCFTQLKYTIYGIPYYHRFYKVRSLCFTSIIPSFKSLHKSKRK